MRKIYVASSWRNEFYPSVVETLRKAGHEVYDFRNPPSGDPGFKWSNVDAGYMEWTPQPCGRSAHTEAGWFAGSGKTVVAYIPVRQEPELMYKLFSAIACSEEELLRLLDDE